MRTAWAAIGFALSVVSSFFYFVPVKDLARNITKIDIHPEPIGVEEMQPIEVNIIEPEVQQNDEAQEQADVKVDFMVKVKGGKDKVVEYYGKAKDYVCEKSVVLKNKTAEYYGKTKVWLVENTKGLREKTGEYYGKTKVWLVENTKGLKEKTVEYYGKTKNYLCEKTSAICEYVSAKFDELVQKTVDWLLTKDCVNEHMEDIKNFKDAIKIEKVQSKYGEKLSIFVYALFCGFVICLIIYLLLQLLRLCF